MTNKVTVIGSYISPYVRKVLAVLELKGISYVVDPIIPFYGNDQFTKLTPARRIPVLIDGNNTIVDSTVIIEYLNEKYPSPNIFPQSIEQRSHARWLDEYADTVMGEVVIWRYFNQLVINRFVWGNKPDESIIKQAKEVDLPKIFDYLESQLPSSGTLFDQVSIADIAVASFFRNLFFARYTLDGHQWPKTKAFVERTLAMPCFTKLQAFEDLCVKSPIGEHRALLIAAGAPISEQTYAVSKPRKGILST